MGIKLSKSSSEINFIHANINILIEYGIKMADINFAVDKQYVVALYKTFYYPRHVLTKLDEMNNDHLLLRRILRKQIKMYNKYNLTNIDENNYVQNTYNSLKKTLHLISV
jgi:hypothetical protein